MLERPWAWVVFALLMLVPPAYLVVERAQIEAPADFGPAPDFQMVAQDGTPFSRRDLAGKVVVLDFIFTRCPDICPLMTTQMVALQRALPSRPFGGPALHLVSVSVDPTHDTPPVLSAYAEKYGADLSQWTFLTGTESDVTALSEGLAQALVTRPTPGEEPPDITHSQRMLLLDPSGHVRGFYPSDEQGLDALVAAIEGIAVE